MPSRTANSIHVIRMCEALSSFHKGSVLLTAYRSIKNKKGLRSHLESFYGASFPNLNLKTINLPFQKGLNIILGLFGFWQVLKSSLKGRLQLVVSRNFYASYLVARFVKVPLVYETHNPESGRKKKWQNFLVTHPNVQTVVITDALKTILAEHLSLEQDFLKNVHVFADAAPAGIEPFTQIQKQKFRAQHLAAFLKNEKQFCVGYFGHLYPGRGIEVIVEMARQNSDQSFFVFGGNEIEINALKAQALPSNLQIVGHVPPLEVIDYMKSMDVLLMPYQKSVSIGAKNSDTSKWMSPMKMFEYMASGVPIISSDLPVLREVLGHQKNCLLATCDDAKEWSSCLNTLIQDPEFAKRLAFEARQDYLQKYTWLERARSMVNLPNQQSQKRQAA